MAQIGLPSNVKAKNPFKNVQMKPTAPLGNPEESKGDVLNKLAGREVKDKVEYVDGKQHNKMGKDDFLKLLAHQMKNQDPLNPMDQSKFAADLAQFSSLEQLTNMNTALQKQNPNVAAESKFYAASFLGKEVLTNGSSMNFKGKGTSANASYQLPSNAEKVIIRIFDQKKQMVHQVEQGATSRGSHNINWNGKGSDGTYQPAGSYSIQVYAWDKSYQPIETKTKASGIVTGVDFDDGDAVLIVDGYKRVFLRDVQSFKLPKTELNDLTSLSAQAKAQAMKAAQGNNQYQQQMKKVSGGMK